MREEGKEEMEVEEARKGRMTEKERKGRMWQNKSHHSLAASLAMPQQEWSGLMAGLHTTLDSPPFFEVINV